MRQRARTDAAAKFSEERVHFTERAKDFSVRGEEHLRIDRVVRHHRRRHVPVSDNHADPGVLVGHHRREQFVSGIGEELRDEPMAGFAQLRLATHVKERQVELG